MLEFSFCTGACVSYFSYFVLRAKTPAVVEGAVFLRDWTVTVMAKGKFGQ